MITREKSKEILSLHKKGKTNKQIVEISKCSTREILSVINRNGLKSNKITLSNLSHKANEFILGSLLGDGCFVKDGRLTFGHAEAQKTYLEFKKEFLISEGIDVSKTYSYFVKDNPRYKLPYTVFTIRTCRRIEFQLIRSKYFENGHKIVPEESYVREFLTPFSLAIWFMDDGNACSQKNLQLNTQSFSRESVNMLRYLLLDLFQVRSTINKEGVITIKSCSYQNFIDLINEFVLPIMKYKYKLKIKI